MCATKPLGEYRAPSYDQINGLLGSLVHVAWLRLRSAATQVRIACRSGLFTAR
jgi:hypothetical protein